MPTPARLLLCFALFATGCASASDSPDPAGPVTAATATTAPEPAATPQGGTTNSKVPDLYTALCDAASAPDPESAESGFGRAHDGLHSLARELQDTDQRAAAGDLLEAKQQVEAAFADDPVPGDLTRRLDQLLTATADALVASGQPRPTCHEGTSP